jgi:hypothetical protein
VNFVLRGLSPSSRLGMTMRAFACELDKTRPRRKVFR